jgi:hypothetical protein
MMALDDPTDAIFPREGGWVDTRDDPGGGPEYGTAQAVPERARRNHDGALAARRSARRKSTRREDGRGAGIARAESCLGLRTRTTAAEPVARTAAWV